MFLCKEIEENCKEREKIAPFPYYGVATLAHLMFYGAFFAYLQFPAKKAAAFTTPSNWVRERRVGIPAINLLQTYYRTCIHSFCGFCMKGKRDSSFSSKRSLLFPRRKCALLQETKTWNLAKTLFENLLFGLNHVFAAERVSLSFSPTKRNTIINPFPLSPFPHPIEPAVCMKFAIFPGKKISASAGINLTKYDMVAKEKKKNH